MFSTLSVKKRRGGQKKVMKLFNRSSVGSVWVDGCGFRS